MKKVLEALPNDWLEYPLKDVAPFLRRGKSPIYSDEDEGLIVINQDCIRWDRIDLEKVKLHQVPHGFTEEFFLKNGDILINSTGTGTIGRVNQWSDKGIEAVADSHVTVVRVDEDIVSPEYTRYFLSSESGQRYLESVCYTGSTNQIELSRRYLSKIDLPFPKLPEQQSIASVFTKVDEAIEAVENSAKVAERLKKSLMQKMLTGKLKPDGTWRSEDEFYVDERFGKVPKGWAIDKLKDITNRITDGEHLSPDLQSSGSYLLSAEDVYDDGIRLDKAKYVKPNDCEKFRKRCDPDFGDVLIVSRGASIGRTCKVGSKKLFCLMGSVILIKPKNEVLIGSYISQYIKTRRAWLDLQRLSGTTAQQAIYLTHLKKLKLSYPKTDKEQADIADILEQMDIEVRSKRDKINSLRKLKKSLMQHLLTGNVRLDIEKINNLLKEAV